MLRSMLLIVCLCCGVPLWAQVQPQPAPVLEGAWEMQAVHWRSGERSQSIDPAQPGLFLFTPTHYSIMWSPSQGPRVPFAKLAEPTEAEILAGFRSIVFNGGRYEATADTVTTTAMVAKVPGFEGGQQFYRYHIDGELLHLTMFDETYPDGSKPAWSGRVETEFVLRRAAAAVAPKPSIGAAMSALQAGDGESARAMATQLTELEPGNAMAWRTLGSICISLKDLPCARAALRQGLELTPDAPQLLYNLAVVDSLGDDQDVALAHLAQIRQSRRFDLTGATVDPNLAALKNDPRLLALLPTAEEFADPFVEPVKIVRQWVGEASGDQFGWIARDIGDVDGDDIRDFVTSAPLKHTTGEKAGRIYVYSTGTGERLWQADGEPGDQLGNGIEAAGDVDGDGIGDVIAGAPGGNRAVVYSGVDGAVLLQLHGEAEGDNFGQHVSTMGDVNGDGHADLLTAAPGHDAVGADAGRAYVYSGKDGQRLWQVDGEAAGDGFGSTVYGYNDGRTQLLVVGAPAAGPRDTGRVYVYRGLQDTPAFVIDSDETGGALGAMFAAVLGDVDGDDYPDVYASDWANSAKGRGTGRVYVHSGATGERLHTFTGETAGEGLGTTLAVAGDVDGDGHADLIVGAWQYGAAAVSGGRAYLYSGKTGELLRTYTGKMPGETFGFDAVGIGDVDADGMQELLITSAWSSIRGYRSGRVLVISSGVEQHR
ncbi:MAG: FG-GAP repeat protein [Xanthomonadales bacterium]|nr:FG-GAP repeat protein [Xanthomonadales bacterium]